MKGLFIALVIASHGLALCQAEYSGQIIDQSGHAISFVTVINHSLRSGRVSDDSGRFAVMARLGDTLRFSAVGYFTERFVATDSTHFDVQMVRDTISLKPVVILGKSLRDAILELELPEEDKVIVDDPFARDVEPLQIKYPMLNPYPGVYLTFVPPMMIAAAINLDQVITEIKKRAPKPKKAKLLPVWK